MGIDYSANVGIGFIVDREDLLAPFRVETEEKFHMEDRYDPKTGKKLEPVKIVDVEAGEIFEFEGKTFEEEYEVVEAIADKLDCIIEDTGGYTDCETLQITVKVEHTDEDDVDCDRFYVGSSILFDNVTALRAELKRVAKGFKKYGVDVGEAKVYVAYGIS